MDDDDDDVKVYEDKCSVTYETAYEEQCRIEQEQVSQDDNGDGDEDCHRHDRLVCPADDDLGHEDNNDSDDDIIMNYVIIEICGSGVQNLVRHHHGAEVRDQLRDDLRRGDPTLSIALKIMLRDCIPS